MDDERPEFKSHEVAVLHCVPVNLDDADGDAATVITIADDDHIEPIVLSLDDTRRLAVRLLASLFSAGDEFAEDVLSAKFPSDDDGRFYWPDGRGGAAVG